MKQNLKIMIAGGCGFVGSSLAHHFIHKYSKSKIYILDNLMRNGSEINLNRLKNKQIVFIKGDLSQKKFFDNLPPCDIFIDAAADPSVLSGINSPILALIRNNFITTINALEWCVRTNCKFIFLSSSRVYPIRNLDSIPYFESETRFEWTENTDIEGFSNQGINEFFDLEGHRSLYGASKFSSELFIQEFGEFKDLKYVINRCGMIAGPWQMGKVDQGIVAYWLSCHIFKKELKYLGFSGSGKQVRDILHIYDLCNLIEKQIVNWSLVDNQVFNIGGGINNSLSLLELTRLVNRVTGIYLPISKDKNQRRADIRIYLTDNTKIKDTLGWEPSLDTETVISDTFEWIKDHKKELRGIF